MSASQPLFLAAAETIRLNIASGKLAPGTVLLESALADLMAMSRAPVKKALALLEQDGMVGRFEGRGYVVGKGGAGVPLKRLDVRDLDLDLTPVTEGDQNVPNWARIDEDVEAELSRCLIFGQYRVVEKMLADTYGVSRTVARDVLGRLQERGIVTKSATSRWMVKPLTAQAIRDRFELRVILEVAALKTAAPRIDKAALRDLVARIGGYERSGQSIDKDEWFAITNDFLDIVVLSTPNEDLAAYISANRKTLQASQRALFSLGMPGDKASIVELRMVADLLLVDAVPSAATLLESHLTKLLDRTIAQLKILSVVPKPDDLAPYVVPA